MIGTSSLKNIECGVPQGSGLGPVLFNIFFDDILKNLDKLEKALYADDLSLRVISKSLEYIRIKLQSGLDKINDWSRKWRLKVSATKTMSLVFNKENRFYPNILKLNLSNHQVKSEKNPKFLGVNLDPGLRLHEYVDSIKQRTLKRLNMLCQKTRRPRTYPKKSNSFFA